MEIFKMDENLYQSTAIDNIDPLRQNEIKVVIDLEGGFDTQELGGFLETYIFWPILDSEELPDLKMLDEISNLGCSLIKQGYKILVHCANGENRASLITGVILNKLNGTNGEDLINYIRDRRPGALANEYFEKYLLSLE